MNKKMTMKDIAILANVSRMTVSRYFNGGYVSQENKEKIKEIIEEYDFIPNVYAQSLKKKLDVVGVIIPTIISRTSTKLLKGLIDEATKNNLECLISTVENNFDKEWPLVQNFINLNVRGIISATGAFSIFEEKKDVIDSIDYVLITQKDTNLPAIVYPDKQAAEDIMTKLVVPHENKIARIMLLGDHSVFEPREEYIRAAAKKIVPQMPFYEHVAIHDEGSEIVIIPEKDTFYICVTDQIAYNLYNVLKAANLEIGKDVQVVGYGDYSTSKNQEPSLTSVNFDYYKAGCEAMKKLLNQSKEDVHNMYVPYEIIIRKSVY